MSLHQFINNAEYEVIAARTNQVITAFSKSPNASNEAATFLKKIAEKCKTREEYLKKVEQRLDLLSNPQRTQELIDWFREKRSSLENLLQGIKVKITKDANYLTKYSCSFTKGLQCLDQMIRLDANQINSTHVSDIVRIKKMLLEVKEASKAVVTITHSERYFLHEILLAAVTTINVDVIMDNPDTENSTEDILKKLCDELKAFNSKWKSLLDAEYKYRLGVTEQLLSDYVSHAQRRKVPAVDTADAATAVSSSTSNGEIQLEQNTLEKQDIPAVSPILVPSLLYSILCDLKEKEWQSLQRLHRDTVTSVTTGVPSQIIEKEAECYNKASKKRKAGVMAISLDGMSGLVSFPISISAPTQKVLDQLQQYSVGVEAGTGSGRAQHAGAQAAAADQALQEAPWEKVVDLSVLAGFAQER